jgi:elongation factor 3
MPALTEASTSTANMSATKENKGSVKVLEELLAKLNVSKEQADINSATHNISVFVNSNEEFAPLK